MRGGIKNAIYLKYRLIITGYAFIQKQEKIHRVRILESGLLLTYIHTYTHTHIHTHTHTHITSHQQPQKHKQTYISQPAHTGKELDILASHALTYYYTFTIRIKQTLYYPLTGPLTGPRYNNAIPNIEHSIYRIESSRVELSLKILVEKRRRRGVRSKGKST